MLLSLYSGCGGLDLGFEDAGYTVALAYDWDQDAIASWNRNRSKPHRGHVADLRTIRLRDMDRDFGSKFFPRGVIGGPPCQGFSRANRLRHHQDHRNALLRRLFTIALRFHRARAPLDFILVENVPELGKGVNRRLLDLEKARLVKHGFEVIEIELNAAMYAVPQKRKRLFVLAVQNRRDGASCCCVPQVTTNAPKTVRDAIGGLPEPAHFRRDITPADIPHHPNHWCMRPRSSRFFDGSLTPGQLSGRSFKTLRWDAPSITVAYGHREVHVHPNCRRRLSVFEAMCLQAFPDRYVLQGSLSSQIDQISEAVPPPLARAVAEWTRNILWPEQPGLIDRTTAAA